MKQQQQKKPNNNKKTLKKKTPKQTKPHQPENLHRATYFNARLIFCVVEMIRHQVKEQRRNFLSRRLSCGLHLYLFTHPIFL